MTTAAMMIPVHVPADNKQSDETRDMITAMRLLSGKDCKRDASQAQVLLVKLSQSDDRDIATDAETMLRVSLSSNWFDDKSPHFFVLERIAQKSLQKRSRTDAHGQRVAIVIGLLVLLFGGIGAYSYASGGSGENPPWILLSVVAAMIAAGFAVHMFRRQ